MSELNLHSKGMIQMKKARKLTVLAAALSLTLLTACGDSSGNENVKTVPIKKSVAVYFSRVGNTDFPSDADALSSASINRSGDTIKGNAELIAEYAAAEAGCETAEIVADKSYPVDYDETVSLAKDEQKAKERPAVTCQVESFDDYDTIWLSFPNWWADLPMPVYSFFDKYDFSGKNIYVFVTHEGSGFSSTVKTIRELEPDANVVEAISVSGGSVTEKEQAVRDYVKKQLG